MNDSEVTQKFSALKKEHEDLSHRITRVNTIIESERIELEKLKAQAIEKYGTSDVEEIKKILEDKREKRQAIVAQAEADINAFKLAFLPIEEKIGLQ